jgi:hypothetical protein
LRERKSESSLKNKSEYCKKQRATPSNSETSKNIRSPAHFSLRHAGSVVLPLKISVRVLLWVFSLKGNRGKGK